MQTRTWTSPFSPFSTSTGWASDWSSGDLVCNASTFCSASTSDGQVALFQDGAQIGSTQALVSLSRSVNGIVQGFGEGNVGNLLGIADANLQCASQSDCIIAAYITALSSVYPNPQMYYEVEYGLNGAIFTEIPNQMSYQSSLDSTCPDSGGCFAVDGASNFWAFNGNQWSNGGNPFGGDGESGEAISQLKCLSSVFCEALSTLDNASFFNGASWSVSLPEGSSINCESSTLCFETNLGEVSTYNGTSWSASTNPFASDGATSDDVASLPSCGLTFCAALSAAGYVSLYNGTSWSTPTNPYGSAEVMSSVDCVSLEQCWSTGGAPTSVLPYGTPIGQTENGDPSSAQCQCATPQASVADPINTATGAFTVSQDDLDVAGPGIPFNLSTNYNSVLAQNESGTSPSQCSAALGCGWTYNLGMNVTVDPTSGIATVTEENGSQIEFAPFSPDTSPWWCSSANDYCPTSPRSIVTLNQDSDGWVLVRQLSGASTFYFDTSGQLTAETDTAGDALFSTQGAPGAGECPISASTCTVWSSSQSGRSITLVFGGNDQLEDAIDQAGNTASFCEFGESCAPSSGGQSGDLASITGDAGTSLAQTTSYTYDSSHDVVTVTYPGGGSTNATTNTYGSGGRVTGQTDPTGATYSLTYSGSSYATDNDSPVGGTTAVTTYPDGAGPGEPSTTDVYSYVDGVEQSETVDTGGIDQIESYARDLTTLIPTSMTNLGGHTSTETVSGANGGVSLPSAEVLTSTDADGNTTSYAYTQTSSGVPAGLQYCTVDPADSERGISCPGYGQTRLGAATETFDQSGKVLTSTDADGGTTTYAYTQGISGVPDELLYCTVDPVETALGVTCPAYGAPYVSGTTTETFDGSGDMLTSTDADGDTTSYTYGSAQYPDLPTMTTDPDGVVVTDTYNAAGEVLTQVVTGTSVTYSATTEYAYDAEGRRWCEVDPYEYRVGVRCPSTDPSTPPNGAQGYTDTIYNSQGEVTSTTNPIGGTTQYAYDGAGHQYCSVSPANYAAGKSCSTATLPLTTPTASNDPYPGLSIDMFSAIGQSTLRMNPLGGITQNVYDNDGNLTQQTVESNNATADPSKVTATSYDPDNQVISITVGYGSAKPATTLTSYDPDGNAFCTVSANAYAAGSSAYHCPAWESGWIYSPPSPSSLYSTTPTSSQADNVTTTFYNADGNAVQTTNADVQTTATSFDLDGRSYCSVDPVNFNAGVRCPAVGAPHVAGTATTVFADTGGTLSTTNRVGDTTSYTYDPDGNKLSMTTPSGQTTTYCYYWEIGSASCAAQASAGGGSNGDLYSETTPPTTADPAGETTTYTYYPGNIPDATTTPSGTTTESYDAKLDLTGERYSGTASGYSTPAAQSYTYNVGGSRLTMTDATGTTTYGYDANGDSTSQVFTAGSGTGLANKTVDYSYFSTGVESSVTYPSYGSYSGPQATYTYDALGNMSSVTDWMGNQVAFTHDEDGNLVTQNNDVSSSNPSGTSGTTYSYDNNDENSQAISTITQNCSGSNETLTQVFSGASSPRNADGQLKQDSESYAGSCSNQSSYQRNYSYDQEGRVVYQGATAQGSASPNVGYDLSGDPTTISSPSSGGFNTSGQTFDDAGELTSQTPGTGSGSSATYSYDTIGALSSSTTGSATSTYGYNSLGQMTSTTPNTTNYLYNGDGLEAASSFTAPKWSSSALAEGEARSVSCPTATFCAVVNSVGQASIFNGTTWSTPSTIDSDYFLSAVSCTSSTFCVAVDDEGRAVTYNGTKWSAKKIDGTEFFESVSCMSTSFCVAVDIAGHALIYNGSSWTSATSVDTSQLNSVVLFLDVLHSCRWQRELL